MDRIIEIGITDLSTRLSEEYKRGYKEGYEKGKKKIIDSIYPYLFDIKDLYDELERIIKEEGE